MKSKIFYSIFAVAMAIFLLTAVLVLSIVYGNYADRYAEELKNEAYYLASAIEIAGVDFLNTVPKEMSAGITYITADGEALLDNFAEDEEKNYLELEEFIEAKEYGEGTSVRYSLSEGAGMVHCTMQLSDGSYLRVSGVQYTVITLIVDLVAPITVIVGAAIILSVFLAAKISSKIIDPVNEIDLEAIDDRNIYPELQPFADKIHEQNLEIDRQMKKLKSEHTLKDEYRREFTANVSHELKTPLTTISGAAELMSAGFVKQEDIPRFAENIYSEAQRLIVLVNDIMELSRLDENAVPEKSSVDLYLISDEVKKRLSEKAKLRHVSLELNGKSTVISGVENVLYEIIFNLCDNAVKYNKEGGKVKITADRNEKGAYITVEDTGIGIPDDEIDRVFERFYRVDKSHSSETSGTGLGLSIVKHGVMLHNGKIELESRVGEGTTVTIVFENE